MKCHNTNKGPRPHGNSNERAAGRTASPAPTRKDRRSYQRWYWQVRAKLPQAQKERQWSPTQRQVQTMKRESVIKHRTNLPHRPASRKGPESEGLPTHSQYAEALSKPKTGTRLNRKGPKRGI
ncbi:Hypothetical predicted protein [Pelobates cultripes]|uniref:Uncharacterized protein n=1 Tax=Pelobates cultripes TaxID=61616 RepID=A0AAD1RNM6_PELCU|nr:Hypothetical predicted protein [Pelobates cultripes]